MAELSAKFQVRMGCPCYRDCYNMLSPPKQASDDKRSRTSPRKRLPLLQAIKLESCGYLSHVHKCQMHSDAFQQDLMFVLLRVCLDSVLFFLLCFIAFFFLWECFLFTIKYWKFIFWFYSSSQLRLIRNTLDFEL